MDGRALLRDRQFYGTKYGEDYGGSESKEYTQSINAYFRTIDTILSHHFGKIPRSLIEEAVEIIHPLVKEDDVDPDLLDLLEDIQEVYRVIPTSSLLTPQEHELMGSTSEGFFEPYSPICYQDGSATWSQVVECRRKLSTFRVIPQLFDVESPKAYCLEDGYARATLEEVTYSGNTIKDPRLIIPSGDPMDAKIKSRFNYTRSE